MNSAQPRPALGHVAAIGALYDAATDSFLSSIFGSRPAPDDVLIRTPAAASTTVQTVTTDTYKDKFGLLSVPPDLGASILGGLVNLDCRSGVPAGSTAYLSRQRTTDNISQAALVHRLLTVREKVDRRSNGLKSIVDLKALQGTRATHVVVTVDYGVETVVELNHRLDDGQASRAGAAVEALKQSLDDSNTNGFFPSFEPGPATFDITVFSDVLPKSASVHNIGEAAEIIRRQVPQGLPQVNMGKGRPVTYRLLPISIFMGLIQDDDDDDDDDNADSIGATSIQISPEHLENFRNTFDNLLAIKRRLTSYLDFLSTNRNYVSPDHLGDVQSRTAELEQVIAQLKAAYGQALRDVRTGARPASALLELYQSTTAEGGRLQGAKIVDQEREKIEFLARAVSSGAMYTGHYRRNSLVDLLGQQHRQGGSAMYVLSFSHAAMSHESWPANKALLFELLENEHRAGDQVLVEDCDAAGQPMEMARIAEYRNGHGVTNDLLERRKFLADKSFAQCKGNTLETKDVQKPVKRRFVKMPCPGRRCDSMLAVPWICPRCFHTLEYGYSDKFIYCDCGRSHFRNFVFKCSNAASHGPSYESFPDENQLQRLLQSLASSDYVNILVLGETGVGKSTFINAFVNYLTFDTLEDALKHEALEWVIPCSFQTQVFDRAQPDGKITEHQIVVGYRDDERDGSKGDSATQQTSVYPINIGSKTIRLIDTPGVGDTRGVQFDKKNMADILATLNSYEELHGILILLKSNSARLTITFQFCVKELLTHLHRSAVNNIAFGFTNTRGFNYAPGDTFKPLQTLLAQQSDVQLSLSVNTTYCFDSESFRYLAAYKQGVIMPREEDFRSSWQHSRDESHRLVDYFQSRTPHSVTSTISLNGTRQLILELAKPLAEISQLIQKNIALCQDREKELADTRLTGDALKKKLQFQKIQLREKSLSRPRTVCADRNCIETKDNGSGERVTEFKSHCHPECFLPSVPAEVMGFPGLIQCWAFMGNDHCRTCRHHWRMHLHILYELEEFTATLTDTRIEKDLAANATDTTLRQRGLQEAQQRIKEYEQEHAQVQDAAAQFGLYLKQNSITAYNDATLEYLDMLIKLEDEKISVGGGRARRDALLTDRHRHKELVAALTARMQRRPGDPKSYTPLDEAGVDAVVRGLYGLKHFGAQLKTVKKTISSAHKATYRERPYRVGSHKHHASTQRAGGKESGGGGGGGGLIGDLLSAGLSSLSKMTLSGGGGLSASSFKRGSSTRHNASSKSGHGQSRGSASKSPSGYSGGGQSSKSWLSFGDDSTSESGFETPSGSSQHEDHGSSRSPSVRDSRSSMHGNGGWQPSLMPQEPPPPYIPEEEEEE